MSYEGSGLEHGTWQKVSVILFLFVLPLLGTRTGKEVNVPGQPKHVEY